MRQLKQRAKMHLQACAVLSQTQRHTDALEHARMAARLTQALMRDLKTLARAYIYKIEVKD